MAVHNTPERVMLGLLQLATDLGTEAEDGSTRIAHLTHEVIGEFVGTSREIVSSQMNRLIGDMVFFACTNVHAYMR